MTTPTIFETCRPREDVLSGAVADDDFPSDLAGVIAGMGSVQYRDPARSFADTYPARAPGTASQMPRAAFRSSGLSRSQQRNGWLHASLATANAR